MEENKVLNKTEKEIKKENSKEKAKETVKKENSKEKGLDKILKEDKDLTTAFSDRVMELINEAIAPFLEKNNDYSILEKRIEKIEKEFAKLNSGLMSFLFPQQETKETQPKPQEDGKVKEKQKKEVRFII